MGKRTKEQGVGSARVKVHAQKLELDQKFTIDKIAGIWRDCKTGERMVAVVWGGKQWGRRWDLGTLFDFGGGRPRTTTSVWH